MITREHSFLPDSLLPQPGGLCHRDLGGREGGEDPGHESAHMAGG